MADVEARALAEAARGLSSHGARILAPPTDVSRPEQADALCDRALEAFGAVDVVCNNAGVGGQVCPSGT